MCLELYNIKTSNLDKIYDFVQKMAIIVYKVMCFVLSTCETIPHCCNEPVRHLKELGPGQSYMNAVHFRHPHPACNYAIHRYFVENICDVGMR